MKLSAEAAAYMEDNAVCREIIFERAAQDVKWGEQNHPSGTGSTYEWVLSGPAPRVGEAARATTNRKAQEGTLTWADILLEEIAEGFTEDDPRLLRAELIQAAAVIVAWVEAIDRRRAVTFTPDPPEEEQ